MTVADFIMDPLRGKTSLSRMIWLYGALGSVLYGAIEFFLDPGNAWIMRLYIIAGLVFSVYVTVGTYQCAKNCGSPLLARLVRISCILTLLLLPVLTYMELNGMLTLSSLGIEAMPE